MEKFKILEERKNPLFGRREVKFNVEAEVTPSHAEVEKLISEKFSASSETMKIRGIHGRFGSRIFTINVNIYNSKEDRDKTEPKAKKEEKEVGEQPAETVLEQPVAEQPVVEEPKEEEPKEEPKPEEKSEEKEEEVKEEPLKEEVSSNNEELTDKDKSKETSE